MNPKNNPSDHSHFTRRKLLELSGAAAFSGVGANFLSANGLCAAAQQAVATPAAADADAKRGGTLRMGVNNNWSTIEPHKTNNSSGMAIVGLVYSQLLKYYRNGELVPDLAERYEMVDPTTYVFYLRPGVTFHDGEPLTAADVVASYDLILDPENGVTVYSNLIAVESVTALSDLEVQFKLSEPQATFIAALGLPGNYIAQAKKIEAGADFTRDVVGTGPFKFISETTGVEAQIERNDAYFLEGLPYLDGVEFRPLTDDSARTNALYSGSVDLITYVPWAQMSEIEQNPEQYNLKSNPADGFLMIDVRVDRPPLDNKLLRQAISYGIDRQAVIDTATSGRGTPCYGGIVPPWMWGYNEEISETYRYDPDKARQLLAEAGAEGVELELTSWPPDNELFGIPSVVVANQLNQIGINVQLNPLATAVYHQARREGTYELLFDGSLYDIPDPDFMTKLYRTGGSRVAQANRYSDPDVDAWLDEARTLTDQDERIELYDKVQQRILEDQPIIVIMYREQGEATLSDVKGHEYLGGLGQSNIVLEIWLDR
jgi:ABC-type transport system substrate-binding protein